MHIIKGGNLDNILVYWLVDDGGGDDAKPLVHQPTLSNIIYIENQGNPFCIFLCVIVYFYSGTFDKGQETTPDRTV